MESKYIVVRGEKLIRCLLQKFTKALLIWRKLGLGRRITRLPERPWAGQLFQHFLTK